MHNQDMKGENLLQNSKKIQGPTGNVDPAKRAGAALLRATPGTLFEKEPSSLSQQPAAIVDFA